MQYGFRSVGYTADVLTVIIYRTNEATDKTYISSTIAFYISKIFEKVKHNVLLHTISRYGIPMRLFSIIKSFLMGGYLKLIAKYQSSEGQLNNAGDTQGSLLGSALFLLSINDLSMIIIRSFVSIYI